jgi:hypothetical protein
MLRNGHLEDLVVAMRSLSTKAGPGEVRRVQRNAVQRAAATAPHRQDDVEPGQVSADHGRVRPPQAFVPLKSGGVGVQGVSGVASRPTYQRAICCTCIR